jgi:hypothetical protein
MTNLYIIRCGDTQLFKIGISKNSNNRIKQLQTGNPNKLKLLFDFKINDKYNVSASQIESTIHHFIKEYNNKHVLNEWFKLTDNEVVYIAKCLLDNFE